MASSELERVHRRIADVQRSYPDRRTREHKAAVKDAYEDAITDLVRRVSNRDNTIKHLRSQVAINSSTPNDEPEPTCSICMEYMCGKVTLNCGHELCPECFAQHARINNTCPFCRETFASKVKKATKMPLEHIDIISKHIYNALDEHHHFDENDEKHENIISYGVTLMEYIKNWYDKDID